MSGRDNSMASGAHHGGTRAAPPARPLRSPLGLPPEPPFPLDQRGLSTSTNPESVTHVPGLECYPSPRPYKGRTLRGHSALSHPRRREPQPEILEIKPRHQLPFVDI